MSGAFQGRKPLGFVAAGPRCFALENPQWWQPQWPYSLRCQVWGSVQRDRAGLRPQPSIPDTPTVSRGSRVGVPGCRHPPSRAPRSGHQHFLALPWPLRRLLLAFQRLLQSPSTSCPSCRFQPSPSQPPPASAAAGPVLTLVQDRAVLVLWLQTWTQPCPCLGTMPAGPDAREAQPSAGQPRPLHRPPTSRFAFAPTSRWPGQLLGPRRWGAGRTGPGAP